jgi:hypothetical protein
MQLPTVCVSSLGDSLQQQQQQQFATTFNNLLAATTLPTQTAVDSPLVSPVFVDVASNVRVNNV